MKLKILYPVIDGEITGGNVIALRVIEEALRRGHGVVANSPLEGKFTSLLREIGVKVYNIDTRRTFRLDSAWKLAAVVKKEGINLIHSHAPLGGTVLSRLAGWLTGVPVINHAHVSYLNFTDLSKAAKKYQVLLNWFTCRLSCARIIAVSEFVRDEIIKQGSDAGKVSVIYNGIDLDNLKIQRESAEIRKEFGLTHGERIIGEVARLGEDKGQYILIRAARRVLTSFPDAVFMIVGEDLSRTGGHRERLEQLAEGLGIKGRIIFTGYRPDIMSLINTFDIFVMPSLIEGLAVVFLEAMAAKKPVITTAVGGNPEVILDGKTGTLIFSRDSGKLAEAIIYHLNHPELSKKMGENGYARVKNDFSLSRMLEKTFDVYRQVLN